LMQAAFGSGKLTQGFRKNAALEVKVQLHLGQAGNK